jgi:hypothetical protein
MQMHPLNVTMKLLTGQLRIVSMVPAKLVLTMTRWTLTQHHRVQLMRLQLQLSKGFHESDQRNLLSIGVALFLASRLLVPSFLFWTFDSPRILDRAFVCEKECGTFPFLFNA